MVLKERQSLNRSSFIHRYEQWVFHEVLGRLTFFAARYLCGVIPEGLLTFLGSLYKEVTKTTSGTLVYRFERQTVGKKLFLRKTVSST